MGEGGRDQSQETASRGLAEDDPMFYVYTLTDPRDGSVFYVGKGKGARVDAHEQEAAKGKLTPKCERIRQIWAAGGTVIKTRVSTHHKELAAYAHEEQLISEVGLANLTNVAPGGRGGRHKRKPFKWTARTVRQTAPGILKALAILRAGQRFYVVDWDMTATVKGVIRQIVRDMGAKAVRKALAS